MLDLFEAVRMRGINANLRVYIFDCLMMYSFDELIHNILEVKEYYVYANQC